MKLEFSRTVSTNAQIPNFMKIRPVVAESVYADGRRDSRDESNDRFRQFCWST